jgi:hypothetical protein
MTATYYASTAERLLAEAQATLDRHCTGLDGRCLACGILGPCPRRESAVVTFSRYCRMPRRRPGASRPELAGMGSPVQWFRQ